MDNISHWVSIGLKLRVLHHVLKAPHGMSKLHLLYLLVHITDSILQPTHCDQVSVSLLIGTHYRHHSPTNTLYKFQLIYLWVHIIDTILQPTHCYKFQLVYLLVHTIDTILQPTLYYKFQLLYLLAHITDSMFHRTHCYKLEACSLTSSHQTKLITCAIKCLRKEGGAIRLAFYEMI